MFVVFEVCIDLHDFIELTTLNIESHNYPFKIQKSFKTINYFQIKNRFHSLGLTRR